MLPFIAALLILIGLLVLWLGRRAQMAAGLPIGRVIYADTGEWRTVEKPLFSVTYRLTGKPDYLVRRGRQVIPIEVKSANAPNTGPRRSHLLQLAAYCLLIQENYKQRPKYGIVKYADRVFEVDYTPELETQLMDVIDALRGDLSSAEVHRSHAEPSRCTRCGMRSACSESLM